MSDYEELRRRNIEDNRRVLAEFGLINPFKALPRVTLKKRGFKRKAESEHSRPHKRPLLEQNVDHSSHGSLLGTRRRSARLQGSATPTEEELKKEVEQWVEEDDTPRKVAPNRPNFYGAIEGVEVGTVWLTRMECCRDGIHRPTVAGIHGGAEGAYSIALSGGYDDNIDLGDCFTYTGEGGRDLKGTSSNPKNLRTAPQSKDQTLTRGNLALSKNVETGQPVRVIRGYKLTSQFAPEEGYRYDGLYSVQKAWFTTGVSGFKVWKFALKRLENQAPPPWTFAEGFEKNSITDGQNSSDEKKENQIETVLHDTEEYGTADAQKISDEQKEHQMETELHDTEENSQTDGQKNSDEKKENQMETVLHDTEENGPTDCQKNSDEKKENQMETVLHDTEENGPTDCQKNSDEKEGNQTETILQDCEKNSITNEQNNKDEKNENQIETELEDSEKNSRTDEQNNNDEKKENLIETVRQGSEKNSISEEQNNNDEKIENRSETGRKMVQTPQL